MSNYFYHPLGDTVETYPRSINTYYTYSGHGAGNLDIGVGYGVPQYAMCDGLITAVGRWNDVRDGTTYCILECKANLNNLNETFYIRYLHGDYIVKTGDVVSAGQKLGTTNMHGNATGHHLHIDFSESKTGSRDPAVSGQVVTRNNQKYYIRKGKEFLLNKDKIDWNIIEQWKQQSNLTDNQIGYCWLVMASDFQKKTASTSNTIMDVSSKLKTDNDWYALYGMLQYEEAGLAARLDDDISKGICEWVVRVFRNRLFSGIGIKNICLWNSGQPGYDKAVQLGKILPKKAQDFCKQIISGNDFFYVEKIAKKYKYGDWKEEKWYNRLYSADTFYGGSSARWPSSTLAKIPFSGGPYFFMEGEFTNEVKSKFWPDGLDGSAAYPNPYYSK